MLRIARADQGEFAVLRQGRGAGDGAERLAQRLVDAVYAGNGALSASVGVGLYPRDGWEPTA